MSQSRAFISPPFQVERALKTVGTNIRIARLRRNLSVNDIAEKIGINRKSVLDAERGKPSTGIGVYTSLLWALGLLDQFAAIADPSQDKEGLALAIARERSRARHIEVLDNDF